MVVFYLVVVVLSKWWLVLTIANHCGHIPAIFTDTRKIYMAYALTVAYSPNFSSPIAFTCMVHQNFPTLNISYVQYCTKLQSDILFTAHLFTCLLQVHLVTCGVIWWKIGLFLHTNMCCMMILNGKF